MTQLSPSTLFYDQALAYFNEFKKDYSEGKIKTSDEIASRIHNMMTQFQTNVGAPLLTFDPLSEGEPPVSEKFNRFLRNIQNDVGIMQSQVDLLNAAAVFVHNYITTEILRAQNHNARVSSKLKTLQLYSSANDNNIITFGDYFKNDTFIDKALVPSDTLGNILSGSLTLAMESELIDLAEESTVEILPTSNGFPGNNQEIEDPALATTGPANSQLSYTFVAETDRRELPEYITDDAPDTWFEYERNFVYPGDRAAAKGYNFVYKKSEVEEQELGDADVVDWASGPPGGVLKLDLQFDLQSVRTINNITYTPFGIKNNVNHPVKISLVQTSETGTDWQALSPQNVWIATDANLDVMKTADKITVGTAAWAFEERNVQYIRMSIEQPRPIDSNIGHLYYETRTTDGESTGQRVEGPVPSINQPDQLYNISSTVQGNLLQKREYFVGKRWCIGIRDCTFQEAQYKQTSAIVTKPFRVDGIIDRVALEADTFIPENFPQDDLWVRFYVSPDEGLNWYPISRIQDDFFSVPEVIVFNDPLPLEFREPGVVYYTVDGSVTSIRLKIEMSRPNDQRSSSPIVHSYKLKIRKR